MKRDQMPRARLHHAPAGLRRPREAHAAHAGVTCQRFSGFNTKPGDDVDHAGRDPSLVRELDQQQTRQRRVLSGLDHDRVAHRDRRPRIVDRVRPRGVPGDDAAAHAVRLAQGHPDHVGEHARQRLPGGLVGQARDIRQDPRHRADWAPLRPAHLHPLQQVDLRSVRAAQRRPIEQQLAPPARALIAPRGERILGGSDGVGHVVRAPARDGSQRLASGGVNDIDCLAATRGDPLATDELSAFGQQRMDVEGVSWLL